MTLPAFLYLLALIFATEAALRLFAACADGKSLSRRFVDLAFGAVGITLAWSAVHYAAGLV